MQEKLPSASRDFSTVAVQERRHVRAARRGTDLVVVSAGDARCRALGNDGAVSLEQEAEFRQLGLQGERDQREQPHREQPAEPVSPTA